MPQNIFKIYDGRTNFWQWDTGQKLIVLDDSITEVHFSNRDMNHSITRNVYDYKGQRVCNIPDIILQLPRNLVAYAYVGDDKTGHTAKSVKFAVIQRPIPEEYVMDQGEAIDDINRRLEMFENMLKDIELGKQELHKFETTEAASKWAKEIEKTGIIVAINIDGKWIAHMIESDYSVTPICNCDGEMVIVSVIDGGDGNGYTDEEDTYQIWDGGNATGY